MHLKISTLLLGLFISCCLQAQEAEISFRIKNAGVFVDGTFDSIQVVQNFNPDDFSSANFRARIPVSTIYTGIKSRDRHLLKAKYFDADAYPNMVFQSTEIKQTDSGYQMVGDLTIKSTTLEVAIDFSIEREDGEAFYKGYLELDRRDYGVGRNHLILGDLVRISIQVPVQNAGI